MIKTEKRKVERDIIHSQWTLCNVPSHQKTYIILLHFSTFCYTLYLNLWNSKDFLYDLQCPACGNTHFKYHAWYFKYHYSNQIKIIRVRCSRCRTTHALMPSFSLPGTSQGTKETEEYLIKREQGISREKAGITLMEKGFRKTYLKEFEKMLQTSILRAKALLPNHGIHEIRGIGWIRSACNSGLFPLTSLNELCLKNGFNAVCCTRFNIHRFKQFKPGKGFSHNNDAMNRKFDRLDSS
jgi:hypothetical protein